MLLQTNSYIVPKEKRAEHARLVRRFKQVLERLGCEQFEVYEQTGNDWTATDTTGRYVQIMHFRDKKHQLAVQAAEQTDTGAQAIIKEFCDLINFPYQLQQGLFAVGFYSSVVALKHHEEQQPHDETPTPHMRLADQAADLREEALLEATQQASAEILAEGVEPEEGLPESMENEQANVEAQQGENAPPEVETGEVSEEQPTESQPHPRELPRW